MGVDYNFDSFYAHITFSRYKGMTKTFLLQYLVIESPPIKCGAGTKWFIFGGGGRATLKSVCIQIFPGPYFPTFELNTGKHGPEKLRIRTLSTQ